MRMDMAGRVVSGVYFAVAHNFEGVLVRRLEYAILR